MTDDLESPGSIVAKLEQAIDACESGNSARGKKHLAAFVIRYRDTILSRLEAADEIARLRAENERLREALERVESDCRMAQAALGNSGSEFISVSRAFGIVGDRAHTALKGSRHDRA